MNKLLLQSGFDKFGVKEPFDEIELSSGFLYAVVGSTGSGKSRLIKDIEMLVSGESVTGRKVLLDGKPIAMEDRINVSEELIAHLGQSMCFVLDLSISEFLTLHAEATGIKELDVDFIVSAANTITEDPIGKDMSLSQLSGGQSRALMIADIAILSNRPIVLIDEIENAGIDKEAALSLLLSKSKLVLIVTHDLHTALLAEYRIVLSHGGIRSFIKKSVEEEALFEQLDRDYKRKKILISKLRRGEMLDESC